MSGRFAIFSITPRSLKNGEGCEVLANVMSLDEAG